MTHVQTISDASDRVMQALIAGLEVEFGRGAGEALAHRFLDAEDTDFLWDARRQERWLGGYDQNEDDDDDGYVLLDRVAILGRLDGRWFVANMVVDGDGHPHGMVGHRMFDRASDAREAYAAMR